MAFYKVPSNIKTSILGFVKHILDKFTVKDIDALLSPCCKPTIEIVTSTCNSFIQFTDVVITDTQLAGQRVTAILEEATTNGGGITQFSFNSLGVWTGNIQTNILVFSGNTGVFTLKLIPENSKVARVSLPVTVTSISSC